MTDRQKHTVVCDTHRLRGGTLQHARQSTNPDNPSSGASLRLAHNITPL